MTSSPRVSLKHVARDAYRAMNALDAAVSLSDPALAELVRIRASQINGCTYCIDEHSTDARNAGEDERRIWALAAWWHTPFFDERERAALALTDAMTRLPDAGVPDDVYARAAEQFDEAELGQLIMLITVINAWNRIGVTTGMQPEVAEPAAA